MATIVTRITGATAVNRPLTNTELDNNFINLNSAIPTNLNQLTNGPGYITGITSANVTTALGFTPYNATNPSGYITSSGNAATATTATTANALNTGNSYTVNGLTSSGSGYFRKNQTDGNYTTAALWTESYGTTTTGVAFHISGVVGKFLEMRTDGTLYWNGDIMLHSGNYNNYAPTLTGTGASGSWGINITGNAATATTATTANALNTGNNYTGNQFTASGSAYFYANRPAISNQAGIQFQTAGTTNWWNFLDNNTNTLTWYQSNTNTQVMKLTQAGSLTVTGDIQTPIFYDSNDTNYYCNPASTSNFSRTVINNALTFGPDKHYYLGRLSASDTQAVRYEVARLFIDFNDWHEAGTFFVELQSAYYAGGDWQKWAINYDYNVGTCYLIEGVSPNGRFAQVTVGSPVQISGDLYYLPVYVSVRYYGNYYTYVKTSWPLNSSSTAGSGGSVWVFTSPSGTNISDFTPASTVFTNNILSTNADVRAPIFYDYDNTNYYLDLNNSSRLGTTYTDQSYSYGWFRTYGTNGLYNQDHGNHWYATSNVYWNIAGNSSSEIGIVFRTGGHQGTVRGYVYADNANNIGFLGSGGDWRLRVVGGDYSLADGSSMRAPIFYDSNDTNYYFDGASTSKWNTSTQPGWHTFENYGTGITGTYDSYRLQTVFAMGASYRMAADGSATNNMYGLAWSHPNAGSLGGANNLNDHGLLIINNGSFRAAISSRAVFSADVRGTLFYDYNDTGYYCDPNGTSIFTNVQTYGLNKVYRNDTQAVFYSYNTSASNVEQLLIGHSYANVYIQAQRGTLSLNGTATLADNSFRAPIFYDSDNTGYYLDPTSTTSLRTIGDWRADAATWTGEYAGKIQYHSTHWYLQYSGTTRFRNSSGTDVLNIDSSGNLVANGNVTAYSDRNKKTNIATLTTPQQYFDKIDAKTFDWKSSGKQDIGFIAQDVEAAGLEMFVQNNEVLDPNTGEVTETVKSLDYGRMVAVLWQTVKELKQELAELKAK
jgi:hypothetical protein